MRYGTIVADPAWPFDWSGGVGGKHRNKTPMAYKSMTLEEIRALPVTELAADDCRLFLWVTPELYREGVGVQVARAWGFKPADELIWEKPNFGMGRFPRRCHEPCLVAQRGKPELRGPLDVRSVQRWSQRHAGNGGGKMHSAKPDGLLDLAEQRSPGPYLELFARRQRLGWDTWGHEALEHVQLA